MGRKGGFSRPHRRLATCDEFLHTPEKIVVGAFMLIESHRGDRLPGLENQQGIRRTLDGNNPIAVAAEHGRPQAGCARSFRLRICWANGGERVGRRRLSRIARAAGVILISRTAAFLSVLVCLPGSIGAASRSRPAGRQRGQEAG